MRPVILNADDYAMDADVDAGILDLARRGVVTATSAMTLSPGWDEAGRRLADTQVDRGLHLDLTSPFATGISPLPSLAPLIAAAFLGRLDRGAIRGAIDAQLERFEAVLKAPPHFVDGHQHVHHLPTVREELIAALGARYGGEAARIGLRLCQTRAWRGPKAAVIEATGARGLSRQAKGRHPANTDFAGVYDFSPRADLPALWRGWLARLAGERPLIMCHVARQGSAVHPADGIRAARHREWEWLRSEAFGELGAELGCLPQRWTADGTRDPGEGWPARPAYAVERSSAPAPAPFERCGFEPELRQWVER